MSARAGRRSELDGPSARPDRHDPALRRWSGDRTSRIDSNRESISEPGCVSPGGPQVRADGPSARPDRHDPALRTGEVIDLENRTTPRRFSEPGCVSPGGPQVRSRRAFGPPGSARSGSEKGGEVIDSQNRTTPQKHFPSRAVSARADRRSERRRAFGPPGSARSGSGKVER